MIRPLLLCAGAMAALAGQPPQAAAMVTDLHGHATLRNGQATEDLVLTAEVASGCPIHLDPGARIALVTYANGEEITLAGPATLTLDARGRPGKPARGIQVTRIQGLHLGEALRPGGLAQASLVMRDAQTSRFTLRSPGSRVVRDARPHFAWEDLGSGVHYTFSLQANGEELCRATPDTPRADLPAGLRLREGVSYGWSVAAVLPDGTVQEARADLALLDREDGRRLASLAARREASFSLRLVYAAALQEAGLLEEAKAEWKALQALRPGDGVLAAYAQ